MKKKLQIFISSTFLDLQEERQAAVEAVLKAGHIPAGMELFKPADESQKETISKWIKESDVYLLILGGRYGAIEPSSKKSYTHWEYDLAGEIGIPRFSLVISETALQEKVKGYLGQNALEMENQRLYSTFKKNVLTKISSFFDDVKDIKLGIIGTLSDYANDKKLAGWISGRDIKDINELNKTVVELINENSKLKTEISILKQVKQKPDILPYDLGEVDFEERTEKILTVLNAVKSDRYQQNYISWWIPDDSEGNEDNESLGKDFTFPLPENEFSSFGSYLITDSDGTYTKLMIITILDTSEDVQARFGDIRVMLNTFSSAEGVPIRFILALPGEHNELQDKADVFLKKVKKVVAFADDELIGIEIWDSNVLNTFEEELGFKV
ncbi:DUF4062 domain-containing protein [Paenibacillus luteus]|uniref:DUF4062 domain-containing protein n=1 Tax=Paenibacillus luteus TaxID=2545753 RepID=UPI0011443B18|nr:DUF4062 domain-containing protein [Paenibacillus luteus]